MTQSKSITELFESYYSELRNSIRSRFRNLHHEADDIVQDAFHNILRVENIDEIENPKAYLYQSAANLALNRIRSQRRRNEFSQSAVDDDIDLICPERTLFAARELSEIRKAFDQLPEKYQKTFSLSRSHHKSYKEISVELNIPESTVEKHIIKTLKHLRNHLAVKNQEVHHD